MGFRPASRNINPLLAIGATDMSDSQHVHHHHHLGEPGFDHVDAIMWAFIVALLIVAFFG
jgi:hypothetical protein